MFQSYMPSLSCRGRHCYLLLDVYFKMVSSFIQHIHLMASLWDSQNSFQVSSIAKCLWVILTFGFGFMTDGFLRRIFVRQRLPKGDDDRDSREFMNANICWLLRYSAALPWALKTLRRRTFIYWDKHGLLNSRPDCRILCLEHFQHFITASPDASRPKSWLRSLHRRLWFQVSHTQHSTHSAL